MASAIVAQVEEYLHKIKVEAAFSGAVHSLLMQDQLPYNPYPNVLTNVRTSSEGFYLANKEHQFENALKTAMLVSGQYSFLNIHGTTVWGMSHLVAFVDPSRLLLYEKLLSDLNPSEEQLITKHEYKTKVIVALVGSAVFHDTFFDRIAKVFVRMEFVISGNEDTEGLKLFIQNVLSDIRRLVSDRKHLPLNFRVPVYLNHKWEVETFSIPTILERQDAILSKMVEAVVAKHYLMLECIFYIDTNDKTKAYVRGCKQYVYNFLALKSKYTNHPILISFAPVPMLTAFEGIFLSRKHAEMYQSIMLGLIDQQEEAMQQAVKEQEDKADKISSIGSFKLPVEQQQQLMKMVEPPQFELTDSAAEIYFWRNGAIFEGTGGSEAAASEGESISWGGAGAGTAGASISTAVQMNVPDKILNELRLYWKIRTVHHVQQHRHMDALPDLILYACLHIEGNRDVLMDIYRLLRSTAERMYEITGFCSALEDTLYTLDPQIGPIVTQQLRDYYGLKVRQIIDGDNHSENVEIIIWGQRIMQEIAEIFGNRELSSKAMAKHVGARLKVQSGYTMFVLYQVLDGCLASLPFLNKALFTMEESIIEMFAMEPRTRYAERLPEIKVQQKRSTIRTAPVKYGIEDDWILARDQQAVVVSSIQANIKDNPNSMALEDLFARYVVDTHLDEVWANYLNELVLSNALPSNPYPRLLNILRQCSARMALDVVWDEENTKALLHSLSQPDAQFNYVYTVPGYSVFGHKQALRFVDPVRLAELEAKIKPVLYTNYKRQWGQYRILLVSPLGGRMFLWGRMCPYLSEVIVEEHCYIKGPERNSNDAVKLFAKFVFEHVSELYKKEKEPIIGVFTGIEEEKWDTQRIFVEKKAFHARIELCCTHRQPFYIKVYVFLDWRAVAVLKYLRLHFTNNEETYQLRFFNEDASEYYSHVFIDKAKTDFHLQYNNATNPDPTKVDGAAEAHHQLSERIIQLANRASWFDAYTLLLRHALITGTTSVIPEVWRMCHSMAGRVDYVAALWRGIADLISYILTIKPGRAHKGNIESNIIHSSELTGNLYILSMNTNLMAEILLDETEIVVSAGSSLTTATLRQAIMGRLREVAVTDEEDGKINVIFDEESIDILYEVDGMLQAMRDTLAHDVHEVSEEAQAIVASMRSEQRLAQTSSAASIGSVGSRGNGGSNNVIVFRTPGKAPRTWPT